MRENALPNPFVVGRYVSPEYFCDRDKETEFLVKQIANGRNVALISPRRMGKTGLIQNCFHQPALTDGYHLFFVDIYATSSLEEFVYLLGKAVFEELKSRGTQWAERFFQVITSLRLGFRLDAMSGEPSFDVSLGDIHSPQTTLDEIFRYLETADKPCIVAIDEFQQIGSYGEKNTEALLRTKIQQCKQTSFIFSGSKRHVMANMFNSPAKPFYQSAITMGLDVIPMDVYTAFAQRLFSERGKQTDRDIVEKVYTTFNGCTWFVQMMMNELFVLTPPDGHCTLAMYEEAERNVVLSQEMSYRDILFSLPTKQKQLLQAIARESRAKSITSSAFIRKHNLASASSVQSAVKGLLNSDIITQDGDAYRVYDYFFSIWLAKEY